MGDARGDPAPPDRVDQSHRTGWSVLDLAGLFPDLFDAAPDAIVVVDAGGCIVLANRQTQELFGYRPADLVGEQVEILVPEGLRARHIEHRETYMKDPETRPMGAELDLEAVHRDGTAFPVEISLAPIHAERGTLVMAAVRDIRERERARQRFEDLLEAAPDAIVLVDREGEIELVNEQTERMFGYEREELLGEAVEVLIPEGLRERHVEHREAYVEEPERRPMGIDLDLKATKADGTTFPVEISLAPVRGDDGLQVFAAVRDVTEQREIQRELRLYAKWLEESNRDLERFADVISHDLREPIRNVKSFVELLDHRYREQLPEEAQEFVDYVIDGSRRMEEMVSGLLAYSRVDSRGEDPSPVNAETVLAETIQALQLKIEETDAEITHRSLPVVRVDRSQLAEVFQNLVENAIKFHREGVPPRIHVDAEEAGEMWRFSVEDNGIGIEPDLQDGIFDVFQRGAAQETAGEGIGLSVCRKVVERHGGEIWADSDPGEGSTFFFTLPKAEGPNEDPDS